MSYKYKLYGAILGDLAGQPYEHKYNGNFSEFKLLDEKSHFTDDTIMTLASAAYMLGMFSTIDAAYRLLGAKYINLDCFGKKFEEWLRTTPGTTGDSWGNGCLMRISPFMYLSEKPNEIKKLIVESCLTSHSHPKSIIACLDLYEEYRGYRFLKHSSKYKPENHVKKFEKLEVSSDKTIDFVKNVIWVKKSSVEAIEYTIKCGGDTDTNASIVGELMNFTFKDLDTKDEVDFIESKLDPYLLNILKEFNKKF